MSATPITDDPLAAKVQASINGAAPIPAAAHPPEPQETPGQAAARRAREAKAAKAEAERIAREGAQAAATFEKTGLRDPVAFFRGKAANLIPDATRFAVRLRMGGNLIPVGQFTARELERDADVEVFLLNRIVPKLRKTEARAAGGFYEFDVTLISAKGQESAPLDFKVFDTNADQPSETPEQVAARMLAQAHKEPSIVERAQEMKILQETFGGGQNKGPDPLMLMMLMQPKGPDPAVEALKLQIQQQGQMMHGLAEAVREIANRPPPLPLPAPPAKTMVDHVKELAPIVGPLLPVLFDKLSNKEHIARLERTIKDMGDQINGQKSGLQEALEAYKLIKNIKGGDFMDYAKQFAPGLFAALLGGGPGPGAPSQQQMQNVRAQVEQRRRAAQAQSGLFAGPQIEEEEQLPAAPMPQAAEPAPDAPAQDEPPKLSPEEEQAAKLAQLAALLKPPPEFGPECAAKITAAAGPAEMANEVVLSLRWLAERSELWQGVLGQVQQMCVVYLDDATPADKRAEARTQLSTHLEKYLTSLEEMRLLSAPTRIKALAACEDRLDDLALDLMTTPDEGDGEEAGGAA